MLIIIVLLSIIIALVLMKYILLKQQIRRITHQIEQLSAYETEKVLDISLIDKDLEELAGQFNRYYEKRKKEVAVALRHEEHLKDMITNVTHDLRTPLTVIDGHLQLLAKTDLSAEQQRRVLAALGKAKRMKELTEAFYDLTLLDAGQMEPHMEKVNVTNLLMNFLTESAILFECSHITPVIHLPENSVFASADRTMLERILQNLVTNAIRYTSGEVDISLVQNQCDETVIFRIGNSLSHNPDIDVDRIFERFYTGDRSRGNGSSGVGLTVVKLLAEKMNGNVQAVMKSDRLVVKMELRVL